jgi:hypothetical protein
MILTYSVDNNVGKMTTECYLTQILPKIIDELKVRGLTLCQDADSAYKSRATLVWAKEHI